MIVAENVSVNSSYVLILAIILIFGWQENSQSDSNRIENRARLISLNEHKELCASCCNVTWATNR